MPAQTNIPAFSDPKDPSDTDAFTFDLRAYLGNQSISGLVTATVSPPDMTVQSVVTLGGLVTVWLSPGGSLGTVYLLRINFSTLDAAGNLARGPINRSATFTVGTR